MTKQTEQGAAALRAEFEAWADANCIRTDLGAWEGYKAGRAARILDEMEARNSSPEGCALNDLWDKAGPQIVAAQHGPEPTLREILASYYFQSGFGRREADEVASKYIAATSHPTPKE